MNDKEEESLIALDRLSFLVKIFFRGLDYFFSFLLLAYPFLASIIALTLGLSFFEIDVSSVKKIGDIYITELQTEILEISESEFLVYWMLKSIIISITIPIVAAILLLIVHPKRKNIVSINKLPLLYIRDLSLFIIFVSLTPIIIREFLDKYIYSIISENDPLSGIIVGISISSYVFYKVILDKTGTNIGTKIISIFVFVLVMLSVGGSIGLTLNSHHHILGISSLVVSLYFLGLFIAGIVLIFTEDNGDPGLVCDMIYDRDITLGKIKSIRLLVSYIILVFFLGFWIFSVFLLLIFFQVGQTG